VFIDESGAKTNMTRFRGRALKGARAPDSAPLCRWTVRTMISSIRLDGSKACMTIDAPTDGALFEAFTEQVRVPTLRPGDVVVMDNLGAHRREEIAAAIARVGAQAEYLPAYSPDLNPIEKMWSKVKEFLRAAKARTSDTLDTAIAAAFQSVTPQDAASWFASCGYRI
jgi:transposase